MAHEEWLTAQEVAAALRVHVETVRRWLRTGELRGYRFGDKTGYRVKASDLEAFLARRVADEGKAAA
jgi:excisionase family DNA binding protein